MSDKNVPIDDTSMFSNVFSYLGLPFSRDLTDDSIDAVIMGVPYDLGTNGRAGARSGPNAIRQASANLRWEERRWPWTFRLGEKLKAADYGDIQFMWGDSDDMLARGRRTRSAYYRCWKNIGDLWG